MLKPGKRDNKKPYSSPIITVYGTVQELTKKVGQRGQVRQWETSSHDKPTSKAWISDIVVRVAELQFS